MVLERAFELRGKGAAIERVEDGRSQKIKRYVDIGGCLVETTESSRAEQPGSRTLGSHDVAMSLQGQVITSQRASKA